MFDIVLGGLDLFFKITPLAVTFGGVLLGIIIGVLPGVGPLLGVILLTPFVIYVEPVAAMGLLIGIYVGGSCGGAITAVLLRIPGTPIAAATLLDGYPMAKKGRAPEAVGLAISASAIGGLIGGIALTFFSPLLARIALKFGPPEYFSLTVTGLIAIAVVSRESTIKGIFSGCLGLLVATVGTDPFTSYDRFTFGNSNLMAGVKIVALLVGLFAISELFIQIQGGNLNFKPNIKVFRAPISSVWDVLKNLGNVIRSSLIGTFIGSLPGAGGATSGFVAYAVTKGASKNPEKFGTGVEEGVISSESANNACCGGALIPTLALGIPGDPIVAVLAGALMVIGFLPGPQLFKLNPDLVGGIFVAYCAANIFLLIAGVVFTAAFIAVIRVRKNRLLPIIALLSIVGTYAVQSSLFDVWCMWFFGLVGFVLRKGGFPLAPMVIARVIGPILEPSFRRSLMLSQGDFAIFVNRPISLVLLIINAVLLLWAILPPGSFSGVWNRFRGSA